MIHTLVTRIYALSVQKNSCGKTECEPYSSASNQKGDYLSVKEESGMSEKSGQYTTNNLFLSKQSAITMCIRNEVNDIVVIGFKSINYTVLMLYVQYVQRKS